MADKKSVKSKPEMPPFCIRRTQLPHISEHYCIYPEKSGACCAFCHISYLEDCVQVDIRGRFSSGGRWFWHDLTEEQQSDFLKTLLRELRLELSAEKPIFIDIDDVSHIFRSDS